jgi:hypothetical protein
MKKILLLFALPLFLGAADVRWRHISTADGLIPTPGAAPEPTATLVLDVDKDGVDDFLIGSRNNGPAVVWYRRQGSGWTRYIVESEMCSIEAGGAFYDIDGDGDLDIVFAGDARSNEVWWWENPYPNFDPNKNWVRRNIKKSGGNKHHDQIFADIDGDGSKELVSWNQRAMKLLAFKIPPDVKNAGEWPVTELFSYEGKVEHEGLAAIDIDGDKRIDIVGGGHWFRNLGKGKFEAHVIDDNYRFSRVVAGQFIKGGRPEVIFGPGDNVLKLRIYQWKGGSWVGRDLLPHDVNHGHSMEAGDIDGDGNLDLFVGEMGQWGPKAQPPQNPNARVWVLYGDGKGNFRTQLVNQGQGIHEGRLGDLNGNRRLDILGKPFRHNAPRLDIYFNEGAAPQKLALDRWRRHVIDENKPWRAIYIQPGDLDNDGRPDLVVGGWWYRNPGQAAGEWVRSMLGGELKNMALVRDFDGDGLPDVLGTAGEAAKANAEFHLAKNEGGGKFSVSHVAKAAGDFLQGVVAARFDPNGPLQVALSWHKAGFGIQMLTPGPKWDWTTISKVSQDEDLSAGDIDRDGRIDLLLGTKWLRNTPTGWTVHDLHDSPGDPDRNRLADINGNGRLDAVVGFEAINVPGKLAWYEQPETPTGKWTEHIIGNPVGPMSLDVRDMDGDGDPDVIVGEHNMKEPATARLLIFENLGQGKSWKMHVVSTGDEHHDGAQAVDIDGDGDLDIVSIGWSHPRVLLYENLARK